MWNSSELKARGKAAMKANYGWTLVVSLILSFCTASSAGASGSGMKNDNVSSQFSNLDISTEALVGIIAAIVAVIAVALIFACILDILVLNPLVVGCQNFFIKNSDEPAEFGELKRGFSPSWKNNVVTMFLTDLFIFLWSMLFIIPGIVKSYSYRLVPYLMAENPDLQGTEAITLSRKLMNGNKWKAFCFDLSFIGWFILSIVTCGLLAIFYVVPYYNCSCAELYKAIRDEGNVQEQY